MSRTNFAWREFCWYGNPALCNWVVSLFINPVLTYVSLNCRQLIAFWDVRWGMAAAGTFPLLQYWCCCPWSCAWCSIPWAPVVSGDSEVFPLSIASFLCLQQPQSLIPWINIETGVFSRQHQ